MSRKDATDKMDMFDDTEKIMALIKLYDGSINYLNKAMEYADQGDAAKSSYYITKANDIIVELDSAVNRKDGSDMSKNLTMLYSFMNRHLVEACVSNSMKAVDEVTRMMTELRDSWRHVRDTFRPSAA